MNRRILFIAIIFLAFFSCSSDKSIKEAEELSKKFFSYLKLKDEKKMNDIYHGFDKLERYYLSDSAKITSSIYLNNKVTVTIQNRYMNELGKLMERQILLYFKRDSIGQLLLFDSKGLTDFSERLEYKFGIKTGCISAVDTTDQQILVALAKTNKVFMKKAIDVYQELEKDIRIVDWYWEPLYSGSASGKGIVVNNSQFSIPSLKYKVTFKTNSGIPITTDNGVISYGHIPAGGRTSFSFYSEYIGRASKASIELVFDNDIIFDYLSNENWTGDECEDYFEKNPTEL